jgi:hypothetical protein
MVVLHEDGSVRSAGSIDEGALSDDDVDSAGTEEVKKNKEDVSLDAGKPEDRRAAVRLIKAEEKSEGRISRKALISFFR